MNNKIQASAKKFFKESYMISIIKGSKYANKTKNYIDFEKSCTPITLKMNYMSSKKFNVFFFGGKGLYINEFISQ
jgi:hypothetical protein